MCETEYGIDTVPPRSVTDVGIDTWRSRKELDLDRIVLHYMQPHVPFRSQPNWFSDFQGEGKFGSSVWWRLCDKSIPFDSFWKAYADNLRWVLEDLDLLMKSVDGTIRVTADHGNAAGERGIYGHPAGVPVPAIREVPWFSIGADDTGEYEPKMTADTVPVIESETEVREQLQALGYRT
jgi:hypothetical protein